MAYPLAALIASGDTDAIDGFVHERGAAVRAYCAAVAAPGEVDEAVASAFAGFAEAVAGAPGAGDARLDAALLAATRTAAGKHAGVTPAEASAPRFLPKLIGRPVKPASPDDR